MKFITALILGTASLGALAVGCSVKATNTGATQPAADAGKDGSNTPQQNDAGTTKTDGSTAPNMCAPDVTGFSDPPYVAANKTGACAATDVEAAYTNCWATTATAETCETWYKANTACDSCLHGYEEDPKHPPVVITEYGYYFNTAGCLELSGLSQTCAGAYNAANACDSFACTPCYDQGADPSSPDGEELNDVEWDAVDGCYAAAAKGACAARHTAAACASADQVKACSEPDGTDETVWKAFYVKVGTAFCGK